MSSYSLLSVVKAGSLLGVCGREIDRFSLGEKQPEDFFFSP